jgi:uncharacterized protein
MLQVIKWGRRPRLRSTSRSNKFQLAAALALTVALAASPIDIERHLDVMVPVRDGVRLSTNIFRPANPTPLPTVLIRTPYGKGRDLLPGYRIFIDRGYAVVIQDVRGRYGSEGAFDPLDGEGPDGSDTIDWIARQPWSNGRVAMVGGSYLGIAQWQVALLNNHCLKAIAPVVSGWDDYTDRFYSTGGAMKLAHRLEWMAENLGAAGFARPPLNRMVEHLPLRTSDVASAGRRLGFFQLVLDHPARDSFWHHRSVAENIAHVRVPVFSVGGWFDNFVESDLDAFAARLRAGHPQRTLIGPWGHDMSIPITTVSFGGEARANVRRYQLDWFERWVKDKPPDAAPAPVGHPLRIFVMGANRWRDEDEWPPERTRMTRFYLTSNGHANSLAGDGALSPRARVASPPDAYTYDPRRPVPTAGGPVCCNPKLFPWGPMDQRAIERRGDVLVYSTPPLREDTEVTGPIRAVLSIATDARDTDFTAKLVDVYPDGRAINLTDGILRLRYRDSIEHEAPPAQPGAVYSITVDCGVTSNVFLKGHRIRVEISSSNFPRFDRNPNTGRPVADETELRIARQKIFHDARRSSYLLLPLIPAAAPLP